MVVELCLLGFGLVVLVVLLVIGYHTSKARKEAERCMLRALRGTPEWAGDEYNEEHMRAKFKAVMRDKMPRD